MPKKKNTALSVGDIFKFGTYPQTASGTDKTLIEWLVLDYDADNNRALLLSRYGLDVQPYNTEYVDITWEKCTLRAWLNEAFMNKAFSPAEQSAILLTNVNNSISRGYSGWNTNGGNDTQDKVFLLSYAEANQYLDVQPYGLYGADSNIKSRVSPTAFALQAGAYTDSFYKTAVGAAAGWWWLRSPSDGLLFAVFVLGNGSPFGGSVSLGSICIRPALWIDLDSDIF